MKDLHLNNEQLPWHSSCREQLNGYIANNRIPHALILAGHEGIGKMLLAQQISHLLLCDRPKNNQACGSCHACKLILAATHPDFIMVSPEEEGKSILIDRIRALANTLTLKPHYAKYRIILINPAHKLNRNAANALLKTLEEPGENNLFLLVTDQLESLPATIRSRCQTLHVPTPEQCDAISWLAKRLPNQNAARLIKIAAGSPIKAFNLAESGVEKDYELLESLWLELYKGQIDPITAASKTEKIRLSLIIEWITHWVVELVQIQFDPDLGQLKGSGQEAAGASDILKDLQSSLDLRRLFDLLEQLYQAKRLLDSSVNRQLMLEAIFISWCSINKKSC
ncbi:MAG TPA: DNA polymerase III subunit delta' [Thermodesulforhabdus norvegica]|uniref:DNA polymerase III subunit delta' n=1 Tax=Thermodesulforhabdus norvegica TaxID=39841 RepID=A0A7C1AXZ4_9BACT|nr:MAG: DNA polymerase III subunit delta' [Gammaproteobacteria bacterium]RLA23317.1 MAG: DNA polymerase III subunit delta' [Gammaproteobacteria bacterium]HDL89828.1 DNA polymerase III subunit delta' [Thermodesulforhabdus norvegica]